MSGRPIKEIAKDLGVTEQSLRSWVKQSDVDHRPHARDRQRGEAKSSGVCGGRTGSSETSGKFSKNAAAFFAAENASTR